jgi:cupin fold WbuC family metalloprotein
MNHIGQFRGVTPAVFEIEADPVIVSANDIANLVTAARAAPAGRARLILHPDRRDTLHEMVIALPPDSCDHPHINFKSGKSFVALSGQFAVMVFSDDGTEIQPFVLSADSHQPGARVARLRRPAWHTIIPLSGDTVFLETIVGPFTGNRFAPWFANADQIDERAAWAEKLRKLAQKGRLEKVEC